MATDDSVRTDRLALRPTPPFDFEHSLAFIDGFAPCAADRHCRDDALVTGGFVGDCPFVATVSPTGTAHGENPEPLSVDIQWPAERGDPDAVAANLRAFLSLEDDLEPLYDAAASDPPFERIVEDLFGYHHVRFATPFEAACWAALAQRTPWGLARRKKRAIVEAAGHVARTGAATVACFPTPARVRRQAPAVERALDHERKARTILEAARVFEETDLASLGDDALCEQLGDVWGFGPWSSEFVTLRGFGRLSRLPRSERRLREAVAERYGLDEPATDADLDRLSRPYGAYRGYWAHYIRVWAAD